MGDSFRRPECHLTIFVEDVVGEFIRQFCASAFDGLLETLDFTKRQRFSYHDTIRCAATDQDVMAFR